jgi:type IV pilus assembly protein PilA
MFAALPPEGLWRQPPTSVVAPVKTRLFHPNLEDKTIMKSTKCVECGFVGWSDVEHCKACGAQLGQRSHNLPSPTPVYNYDQSDQQEGPKKGLAIAALVLGIIGFFTVGILGVGAIIGIVLACMAMSKIKRDPWLYGGRGMAIAALVLNIVSLVSFVPMGIIAAIAIPNLLAARRAANEGSAMATLRTLHSAEATYQATRGEGKYGTLSQLAAEGLIDSRLATGTKNGYNFTVELTTNESNYPGFSVVGVPMTYRSTGVRSFFIDETGVIRAGDNSGGPSTKMDQPLDNDSEFYDRSRRVDYRAQPVY